MEGSTSKRIHPLVAGAAVSVMLVSLVGVAAITGILPTSHGSAAGEQAQLPQVAVVDPATAAPVAAAPVAAAPAAAAPAAATPAPVTQPARASRPAPKQVAKAPEACYTCGRVESVQAVRQEAQPSGVGMVAGAIVGGVLGNQVGGGNGRKLATVAGAVGGGYAGNKIEQSARATTTYQVNVRMEGGELRSFPYEQQPGWSVGDRVRVVNGQLAARG